jgi:hypothetical protein
MSGSNNQSFGSSTTGTSSKSNMNYNTPAIQVGNAVRDGDQFVLLVKPRQGSEIQVWSSGDDTQTTDLIRQGSRQLETQPA